MSQKTGLRFLVSVTALVSCLAMQAQADWLDGWGFRRGVKISRDAVGDDLTDFPVLVRLSTKYVDFGVTRPDGYDIRFTAADGVTLLDFEREAHDHEGLSGLYWVRLPFISSQSDTVFYLYYGNRDASDGANPTEVWDGNHVAVWHLGSENGVAQPDSTAFGNHLNLYGDVAEGETGAVGSGVVFDKEAVNPQYLASPPGTFPTIDTTEGVTLSAWVSPITYGYVMSVGGGNWSPYWRTSLSTSGGYVYGYSSGGTGAGFTSHGISGIYVHGVGVEKWSYLAVTVDYDSQENESTLRLYLNGDEVKTHSVTNRSFRDLFSGRPLVVGARNHSSWPSNDPQDLFGGSIDEARISTVRRSAAWIAASYANQKPDSDWLALLEVEAAGSWYARWRQRRAIMIDHTQIDSDLTNFPLLVRLPPKVLESGEIRPDGFDVRFTAADGVSPLSFERDTHDSGGASGLYWFVCLG